MSVTNRVYVQDDQVIFEAVYPWPHLVELAERHELQGESIPPDQFIDRFRVQLEEADDIAELLAQFLADSSEEK
jgi:folylpolyglutamate synthase/dihydropteroate synthase